MRKLYQDIYCVCVCVCFIVAHKLKSILKHFNS